MIFAMLFFFRKPRMEEAELQKKEGGVEWQKFLC